MTPPIDLEKLAQEIVEEAVDSGMTTFGSDCARAAMEGDIIDALRKVRDAKVEWPSEEKLKEWALNEHPITGRGRPGYLQTYRWLKACVMGEKKSNG